MASTIAVIGTGYVGLTTGACFAHLGHNVICADIVQEKVDSLQRGEIPIHEPGLEEIVRAGMRNGTLSFVLGAEHAVVDAEFVYLCVPTPQTADGSADLRYLTDESNPRGRRYAQRTVELLRTLVFSAAGTQTAPGEPTDEEEDRGTTERAARHDSR